VTFPLELLEWIHRTTLMKRTKRTNTDDRDRQLMTNSHHHPLLEFYLQNISEPLLLIRPIMRIQMHSIPIPPILPIPLPIIPRQNAHLRQRSKESEQTHPKTNPHPPTIIRRLTRRENIRAQYRSTLPPRSEDRQPGRPSTIRRMCIAHPSQKLGDRNENKDGEEEAEVSGADGRRGGQYEVPDGGQEGGGSDEGSAEA